MTPFYHLFLLVTLRRSRRVSCGDSSVAYAPSGAVLSEALSLCEGSAKGQRRNDKITRKEISISNFKNFLNLPIKERLSFAHERFLDSSKLAPLQPQNSPFGFKQLRLLTLRFAKYCYPKMRSIFLRRSRKYQISKNRSRQLFSISNLKNLKNF